MSEPVHDIPLFPLGIAALPHEVVPLHIFEDRYKAMIAHCLTESCEFGMVFKGEDGANATGCAMEVTEVLETAPDGRMNILTRGTRPFQLVSERHDLAYPAGEVRFLADAEEEPDAQATRDARSAYAELVAQATDRELSQDELDALDAYTMAATVDFGPEAKQGLLDLRSENARLRLITRLLRAAMRRLDYVERAQAKARSNGKVRFS